MLGTVVATKFPSDHELTVTHRGATKVHSLSGKCVVTLNGSVCPVTNLKPGDTVEVDGQPAVRVTATRR